MIKPKTKPSANIFAWIAIYAWLVVSFAIGGAIGALAFFLTNKISNQPLASLLVGIASYGTVLLALVFIIRKFWKQKDILSVLGIRGSITLMGVIWAAIGYGVYFLVSWGLILLLAKIFHSFDPNAIKLYDRTQVSSTPDIILGLLQVAIFTPIIEEIIFRGYLFGELERFKMPTAAIIVVTGLVFGALHYPPMVWVVDTAVFGLVCAFIRYKTGNIWAGLALHMIVNTIGFCSLFVVR